MISEPTRKPSGRTGGAGNKPAAILGWFAESEPHTIGPAEFASLRERFAPLSERRLRRILHEGGVPMEPLVEGVHQDSFDELERTLLAVLTEYERAPHDARRAVIRAKDHARWCMNRADEARKQAKGEMILWMLTWLENPGVFPEWLQLRKRAAASAPR